MKTLVVVLLLVSNVTEATTFTSLCLDVLGKAAKGVKLSSGHREEKRAERLAKAKEALLPIKQSEAARFDAVSGVYNAPEALGRNLRSLPPDLVRRNGLSAEMLVNRIYRVSPDKSGRPVRADGRLLKNENVDGFIWVLTLDHRLLVSTFDPDAPYNNVDGQAFKHTSFTGGQPVLGAGKISVVKGKMRFSLDEDSGHYGPNQETGRVHKVIEYLEAAGFAKDLFEGTSYVKG